MSCTPARTAFGLAPRDERTGLALLGPTLHELRGIRFEDGPGGDAPPATPPAPPTDPATPPAPPSDPQPADPPADPITAPVGGVEFKDLPPETQAEVRRLRTADRDWRAERTTLQEQLQAGITPEQRKAIGLALGYEQPEAPDAAALAAQAQQAATRQTELESSLAAANRANMVLLQAPDAGARAASLLDSKGFTDSIAGLDPTDSKGIRTAIDTWLKDHPEHKAVTVPGSSAPTRQQGAPSGGSQTGLAGAIAKQIGQ